MADAAAMLDIAEEDALRADLYDFIGAMLSAPPSRDLLTRASRLAGDDTDIGRGVKALATIAGAVTPEAAKEELWKQEEVQKQKGAAKEREAEAAAASSALSAKEELRKQQEKTKVATWHLNMRKT